MKNSICKIYTKSDLIGTGFFLKISFENDILKYGSVTYYNGNSIKTFEIDNNTNKKFNCISLKCKNIIFNPF